MNHLASLPVIVLLTLSLPWLAVARPASAQDVPAEHIRQRVEALQAGDAVTLRGAEIASRALLPAFYLARDFEPAWTRDGAVSELLSAIAASYEDGLTPADYHDTVLHTLDAQRAGGDARTRADFDVIATDSLIRLAYHLSFGKVDPQSLDRNWNLARTLEAGKPLALLQGALASDDLWSAIDAMRPDHWAYDRLRTALARYRGIVKRGGWPRVARGPTLELGANDARVLALRARLAAEAMEDSGDTANATFDTALEAAVKGFQRRHGIDVDGRVGAQTLAALNVPAARRVDRIRVNLERARWVLHDLDEHFVVVNIAGFDLFEIKGDRHTFRTTVQVGTPFRETPIFKSKIEYMVLNPTWTVPPSILREDILPEVKRDPGYLASKNIRVRTRGGETLAASSIDWSQYESERGFPYRLVQDPGKTNALGRIKFMFPNEHAVYLHDTPSKGLFERSARAFSSGCIRVKDPMAFANRLMLGSRRWTPEALQAALDSNETRTIRLEQPLTVMLMYWTVAVPREGIVAFKNDIYQRDARVLQGLGSKFRFRESAVTTQARP